MTSPLVDARTFAAAAHSTSSRSFARVLRRACGLGLLLAAGIHVVVGFEHAGSSFGTASFAAGAAQAVLGAVVMLGSSAVVLQAVVVLNLMLVQLYVLNLTVGLPPAIAHSHLSGDHVVLGLTLAWPGDLDPQGAFTQAAQVLSVACVVLLGRRGEPS